MVRRVLGKLSNHFLKTSVKPGRYADGGNLYLCVSQAGTKRFAFIYTWNAVQHELGCGSVLTTTLTQARAKAATYRSLLGQQIDPITARQKGPAPPTRRTFQFCAEALIESKRSAWRSQKHAELWGSSLGAPWRAIQQRFIDEIDTKTILEILQPLWTKTPETASRLRGRV